jgi:hypothetical protein
MLNPMFSRRFDELAKAFTALEFQTDPESTLT